MKKKQIAVNSIEISKALLNKSAGFHTSDLYLTNRIGNATRLAANIKFKDSISKQELEGISCLLKQDYGQTLHSHLKLLEELGWITINNQDSENFIEEHIPLLDDVLKEMGVFWNDNNPTNVELASVETLSLLKDRLIEKESLMTELSLPEDSIENSFKYGEGINVFSSFISKDDVEVAWTPLYWPEHVDDILKFLKRQSYADFEEIENVTTKLDSNQGLPIEKLENSGMIHGGIASGYFPSVAITNNNVKQEYIFKAIPDLGINPKNDIFEKARQIVSCIRHGQYHAAHSRIIYPISILNALEENRLAPHSHARIQYSPLLFNGVCNHEEVIVNSIKRYKINFIESPENKVAMKMAKEMLKGNSNNVSSMGEPEIEQYISEGSYNLSAEQRYISTNKEICAIDDFNRLLDTTSGYRG